MSENETKSGEVTTVIPPTPGAMTERAQEIGVRSTAFVSAVRHLDRRL
jgi:hypothetical protein